MPLVRIDLPQSISAQRGDVIAEVVYQTLVDVMGVPANDRFQVVTQGTARLHIDPHYLDIDRTPEAFLVDITLNAGRTTELKQQFYAELVARLHDQAAVNPADVMVVLTEVAKENWSFGNGEAQYVK
ncbi:hypothetical protein A5647_05790 [Mycobacterium sp. 1100029.7]|nr:hypothetical protein A5647_05790 [Mycobacterium sp. 1100029.7]